MQLTVDPKARGLIFDFDGTLGDTLPIHFQAWQETARQFRFDFPENYFQQVIGMSTDHIVHQINQLQGLHLDVAPVAEAKNRAYLHNVAAIKLMQPVFRIVQAYHEKMPIALGTSDCREIVRANIKATGLERFFTIIVTADDVPHPKPEPDIFLKCAALMKVPPQLCQVFEDGVPGFAAAQKAGMILTDVRPFLYVEKGNNKDLF